MLVPALLVMMSFAWPTTPAVEAGHESFARLIGQKLVVAMAGTTPDADLLLRIQRGEIGGVILFGRNISSAAALRVLTAKLQAAAEAGGQPRLLIATDQEGGSVRRLTWAPPTLSPPQMGALGSASVASAQGRSTGYVLRCAGIDSDLAPVADVPGGRSSFMYEEGRTWSFDAKRMASLSAAFASGLMADGDIAAMKHFPGIGLATQNTDSHVVTISAPASALGPGLQPYRQAMSDGIPMIMLSNATYSAYDRANGAGWSRAISSDLLRVGLGFRGVTITDSLSGTAAARGVSATSLAIKSAQAGTDMILLTGSEASTASTYSGLLQAAKVGTIPLLALEASYNRILAMKATIADPVPDGAPPSLSGPRSTLYAPATLGSATVPVRTSWSASDPCSISSYSLESRIDAKAWIAQRLPTPTATSVTQSLSAASTYRFIVKAADGAGNSTGWTYGPSLVPFVRQSSSTDVRFSTSWRTGAGAGYSGGSTRYATTAGTWASYTFSGSGIGWVAAVSPTRGSAKVYVDGRYAATVSLHSTTTSLRRIVFATNWPSQGTHTIRIVVLGTAGHPRVDIDAFVRLVLS
jgi:beta-N-acetylhexosaminidase